MSIRQEGDWYIDENNNRWSCRYYTSTQAESRSRTLSNCSNCTDCNNCSLCSNCTDCNNCSGCTNCSYCSYCRCCDDCSDCRQCTNCSRCSRCNYCRHCCRCDRCGRCAGCNRCDRCSGCTYCNGYTVNPQRIYGRIMGSRNDTPAVYWVKAGEEQCVVGCFRGTLDELEARVKETHKDNPKHLHDYLRFIKGVRAYQEACKDADVL